MYNNALRPSTLFGMVLLLLAVGGALFWMSLLLDETVPAFDTHGTVFLGFNVSLGVLSLLFFARVRWVRIAMSLFLHGLVPVLAVNLYHAARDESSLADRIVPIRVLGLGLAACVIAILALHHQAMKADLSRGEESPEIVARRRYRVRRVLIVFLAAVVLALAYGAWRIVPLILTEPTITTDYVTEYDRVTKPADYDPNRNAAVHYELFFANLSELPETLATTGRWAQWPDDLTRLEYEALEEWAAGNEPTLHHLEQAVRCPYWWTPVESEDGSLGGVGRPAYLMDQRRSTFALVTLAQYYAQRGDVDRALDVLIALHTMGWHSVQKAAIVDQMVGLAIWERTYETGYAILDHHDLERDQLDRLRRALTPQISQVEAPRFAESESLLLQDCLQRTFTDDGSGEGRIIPGCLYEMKKDGGPFSSPLPYLGALWVCLNHPSRTRTLEDGQRLHAVTRTCMKRSPWQMMSEGTSCEGELDAVVCENYLLRCSVGVIAGVIEIGWHDKTAGEAFMAVLAILTYKAQRGSFPESLDELVAAGLLTHVPMDPYSEGPLVYRVKRGDFTLYSVGDVFCDDGGIPGGWNEFGFDRVFWPVVELELELEAGEE